MWAEISSTSKIARIATLRTKRMSREESAKEMIKEERGEARRVVKQRHRKIRRRLVGDGDTVELQFNLPLPLALVRHAVACR